MATQRTHGNRIKLKAYAGINPATGKAQHLYDSVPADVGKRELDRRARALNGRANALADSRRQRRRDPAAPKAPARPRAAAARTIGDAVEAWWKHHGSKLAGAPKTRPLIDQIILPHLGDLKVTLVAGTPPDDELERDDDLVYLAERWEEIRLSGRKTGGDPLSAATIHKCHGIVGASLRRAGHPITDPGLPTMGDKADTTPLPEEMASFLPHLDARGRTLPAYTATRRVRGTANTVSYEVPARAVDPSAMELMTTAFALLVASGPRPVEVAAITRTQIDLTTGSCSLDGRGVILTHDQAGKEQWLIAGGETAKRRRRVITLDTRTLAVLKRWFAFQQEASLAMGERLGPRALVFSLDAGGATPVSPKVFSAAFARTVERARQDGVPVPDGFHLYDMRHFGISQLLRAGRPVAAVARRFGTSPRMVHQRYEHAIPGDDAALADTLGAVWGNPQPGTVIPLGRASSASDGRTASLPPAD
jgi:integrase